MFLPEPEYKPTPEATAAGHRSVLAQAAEVDTAGRLAVRFEPRYAGWLVRRLVVQGPAGSVARVYVGEPEPLNMADATSAGATDVADYAQPLYVPPAASLVVVWTDADGTNIAGTAMARAEIEDIS